MTTIAKMVKKGDILSYTQYFTVESCTPSKEEYKVKDDSGRNITISGNDIVEEMSSSTQFTETKKISRTELVEIFKSHPRTAMTVNFNLKIVEKDVIEKLSNTYPNKGKLTSKVEFDKIIKNTVKEALEGKERTMTGRHYGSFDDFGRASFIDMELTKEVGKTYDTRTRQVDPRTINWLIVNGMKYMLK